jgi:hypothetical protein
MCHEQRGMFLVPHVVFTLYLLLLAAHIGLIWWLPYFPTQDGPSHLYNLVILRDLLHGGGEWGRYFDYQLRIVPNMGFTLLAYPLLHFFPPLIVEKITLSIYIILMGTSVPVLQRAFGKPLSPLSFFLFPVIFNTSVLMGFYSYVLGVPIFILSLGMAWSIRDRSIWLKILSLNAMGFLLFCIHIIPFGFFLMSLLIMAVIESMRAKEKIETVIVSVFCMGPCLMVMFYYLFFGSKGISVDFSYLFSLSRIAYLITDLFLFSTVSFPSLQMFPAFIFIYMCVVVVYFSIKSIVLKLWRQGDIFPSDAFILLLTTFLTLLYLVSPNDLFGIGSGMLFNQRFPWVILLVLLPLLDFPISSTQKKIYSFGIIAVVSGFFLINVVVIKEKSKIVANYLSGVGLGLPREAIIMGYKPHKPTKDRVDVLLHAPSYYGIFSGCVDIGNYEAKGLGYFPVRFKSSFPAIPHPYQIEVEPERIEWKEYPAIEYLLAWEAKEEDKEKIARYYKLLFKGDALTIWQRI